VRPLRHARSTILLSSINVIRASSHWDAYLAALPPAYRGALLDAVAGTWVPIEAALAHYRACDGLNLPVDVQLANGRGTFERAGATIFGTITKMAREVGVTPWTLLPHMQRFWDRGYDGGGISVVEVGPKEARIEGIQVRLLESRYYRNALRGLLSAVLGMFTVKVYIVERPNVHGDDSAVYRAQWV
jgi:hypothetical protein